MIARTASMVFVSTETEAEALLLEANFIKQMKPRYNVLLRDDKSFPYILLTSGHRAPQLMKHRGARISRAPISVPSPAQAPSRARSTPCSAPSCCAPVPTAISTTAPGPACSIRSSGAPALAPMKSPIDQALAAEAQDFLSGRSRAVRERMAREMREAAEALAFEKAARLRDRIAALSAIQGEQSINPRTIAEADVFAIAEEAGQFCIETFFFRMYQNWGNRAYFPRADRTLAGEEVLDAFLAAILPRRRRPASCC